MKNRMRVVWAAFALLVALFIAVPAAFAQSSKVFRATGINGKLAVLRIFFTPCENAAVLKVMVVTVKPELLDKFQRAKLTWDGRDWESCWLEFGGNVYSIDEDGSPFQPIPMALFKDESI